MRVKHASNIPQYFQQQGLKEYNIRQLSPSLGYSCKGIEYEKSKYLWQNFQESERKLDSLFRPAVGKSQFPGDRI